MHLFSRKLVRKITAAFLVAIFICTPFLGGYPKDVGAISVVEVGPSGAATAISSVKNTVTAVGTSISAAALKSLGIKDWALDGVAFALAKKVVSEIAQSTVRWINTGFQGSPMYVTDPGAFLLNVADKAAGDVLYGSDLKFLCSPINVRIALNFYYQGMRNRNPLRCTLTSAVGNVQNFIDGNFGSGGWPALFSVSLNPVNSNFGAVVAGEAILTTSIYSSQSRQMQEASWGRGFLSSKKCTTGPDGAEKCVTVTPGDTISQALSFELSTGERSLIEADEVNEIIGALAAQMLKQGLTAAAGVFGLGNSGSGASGYGSGSSYTPFSATAATQGCDGLSYLDQMSTPACNPLENGAPTGSTIAGSGAIAAARNDEQTYQAIHQRVVSATNAVIAEAKSRGGTCGINDAVIADATAVQRTASSSIIASQQTVLSLMTLETRADLGSDQEKLSALTEFATLVSYGTLHTSITNVEDLDFVEKTLVTVTEMRSRIKDCPTTTTTQPSAGGEGGGGGG